MHTILFGGHTDPGFFIYLLRILQKYLDKRSQQILASLQFSSLSESLERTQQSDQRYSLILPAWGDLEDLDVRRNLQQSLKMVTNDVNAGHCRVFFDFCNESAPKTRVLTLATIASSAGISKLDALTLISQNRLLSQCNDLPIEHLCADVFLVCGWHACRIALEKENLYLGAGIAALPEPQQDILCLNATPRWTRLFVLLKLVATGHLVLDAPDHDEHCQIPYVSFPGLSYEKGESIDLDAFKRDLVSLNRTELLPFIEPLLARTPLRVDNLQAKGNDLAMLIDLNHYRDSKLSLVTETGMDEGHCRITEKTLKPLALGQPCITFSHRNSLSCVRELGYATYDECLDNSYDDHDQSLQRLDAGIESATAFLSAFASDSELRRRVRETNLANIRWTLNGFPRHYYEKFAHRVVERLAWMEQPNR